MGTNKYAFESKIVFRTKVVSQEGSAVCVFGTKVVSQKGSVVCVWN